MSLEVFFALRETAKSFFPASADFSVLRDAADRYPFARFLSRAVPALLPTLVLLWLDLRGQDAGGRGV